MKTTGHASTMNSTRLHAEAKIADLELLMVDERSTCSYRTIFVGFRPSIYQSSWGEGKDRRHLPTLGVSQMRATQKSAIVICVVESMEAYLDGRHF